MTKRYRKMGFKKLTRVVKVMSNYFQKKWKKIKKRLDISEKM